MGARRIITSLAAAVAAAGLFQVAPIPSAQADPCPDAKVIYARGTDDRAPLGDTGESFVSALRSRVSPKSVQAYGVDYPASLNFDKAVEGIADTRAAVMTTAAQCPNTRIVLSGFSQGAAVIGFVTASKVPDGISADDVPAPMPAFVADQVSAVVLFAKPAQRVMRFLRDPAVTVGPRYITKAIELCVENDLICDSGGSSFAAHDTYAESGMTQRGAVFAATKLMADWAAQAAAEAAHAPDLLPRPDGTPRLPGPRLLPPHMLTPTAPPARSPVPEPHFSPPPPSRSMV